MLRMRFLAMSQIYITCVHDRIKQNREIRTPICLSSAPVARYLPSGLKHTQSNVQNSPSFYTRLGIINLGGPITPRRQPLAIGTKPYTTHDTLMQQGMNEIDIEHSFDFGIEESEPV